MISIIIPIYNIATYIKECLESIYNQTYKDFEVILIDDGSTDNTYEVCNNFINKNNLYNKFKLFKKNNAGVVAARLDGLKFSSGDWIMFVDGDDTLEPTALETLTKHITKDVNIIIGTFNYYINGKKKFANNKSLDKFNADEYIDLLLLGKVYVAPWAKLYRKKILTSEMLELPSYIKNKEDFIMNMRIACSQRGYIYFINDAVYNYRYRREKSALTLYKINLQYELKIKNYIIEALKKYNVYNIHKKYISYYYFDTLWCWKNTYKNLTIYECNELLTMLNESMIKKKTVKSFLKFIIIKIILIKESLIAKL